MAGFAPLIAGRQSPEQVDALIVHSRLTCVPGTSLATLVRAAEHKSLPGGISPAQLLAGADLAGSQLAPVVVAAPSRQAERAEGLRQASLQQIVSSGFGEYFDPFTGEGLGATEQSWTAAVALDWLANEPRRGERKVA